MSKLFPCPICNSRVKVTKVPEHACIDRYIQSITVSCPECTISMVRDNFPVDFTVEDAITLIVNDWNALLRHQSAPLKTVRHKCSGQLYKYLGFIEHKDEVTREWCRQILYEGNEAGKKYSRTIRDFNNNFEEIE
jgi:hypothetical protein